MRKLQSSFIALVLFAAVVSPTLLSGCSGRATYYDADYRDYHPWNHTEIVFYGQWETETHRDHHDFKQRSADEQKEYWHWRHDHDNDRH